MSSPEDWERDDDAPSGVLQLQRGGEGVGVIEIGEPFSRWWDFGEIAELGRCEHPPVCR